MAVSARSASFEVVAIVLERPDLLNRFTRYYLAIGASHVTLFHDGPIPMGLTPDPAVTHIAMDDAFWVAQGVPRPEDLIPRQVIAYNLAVRQGTTDWTLVVDADEFLVTPHPFTQILEALPAEHQSIRIRNGEAVWGPSDGFGETLNCGFVRFAGRAGRTRRLMNFLHGDRASMLRLGVTGYSHGKHAVRNGDTGLDVRVHSSCRNGVDAGVFLDQALPEYAETILVHFDAIDYQHWLEKWRRRRGTPWTKRELTGARHGIAAPAIFSALDKDDDGAAARDLFETLHCATRWQIFWLRLFGYLKPVRVFSDPTTGDPAYPK